MKKFKVGSVEVEWTTPVRLVLSAFLVYKIHKGSKKALSFFVITQMLSNEVTAWFLTKVAKDWFKTKGS